MPSHGVHEHNIHEHVHECDIHEHEVHEQESFRADEQTASGIPLGNARQTRGPNRSR